MEAEVPLLRKDNGGLIGRSRFTGELNRVNRIALPMIVMTLSQFLLRVSPMFMLGHLDEFSLSSASIATSLTNVTGFSVLFGMASALETLCGQAYGVGQSVLYVKYSQSCKETSSSFSRDIHGTVSEFFQFAMPSAFMVCLEWWSFELVILLSGVLPNPQLETSVLTICFTITSLHYHIPYSFGAAASTLISNELGGGKPKAARDSLIAVLVLSVVEFVIASIMIIACGNILGYAFSEKKEVVDYVKEMTPLVCLSIIMDSLQAVLSGVARGCGWQHIGAYVNLSAYYLVGIPVALFLGFVLHLKGSGLWCGLIAGATVQSITLSVVTGLTNWEKQAMEARQRIFAGEIQA